MTKYLFLTILCFLFSNAQGEERGQVMSFQDIHPISSVENPEKQQALTKFSDELAVIGKNEATGPEDFAFKMGERINILVTGSLLKLIKAELNKGGSSRSPILLLDGIDIKSEPSSISQTQDGEKLRLSFFLRRNPTIESSRQAWDKFFMFHHEYKMTTELAISFGNILPLSVTSKFPVRFYVAKANNILFTIAGGILILVISLYFIVKKTNMLKDSNTGMYSLGKSQMAFWGLIVLLTFIGVWILTGTMEYIPMQVLILLGISGATGLTAMIIQKSTAQETEKKSNGFWYDICSDVNGVAFHRLQVVIWTLVLGTVFIRSVAKGISMPEFPETLLLLMGVSNLTYLGFKFPEKS